MLSWWELTWGTDGPTEGPEAGLPAPPPAPCRWWVLDRYLSPLVLPCVILSTCCYCQRICLLPKLDLGCPWGLGVGGPLLRKSRCGETLPGAWICGVCHLGINVCEVAARGWWWEVQAKVLSEGKLPLQGSGS